MVMLQYDVSLQNELRNALQERLKHAEHAKICSKTDNLWLLLLSRTQGFKTLLQEMDIP